MFGDDDCGIAVAIVGKMKHCDSRSIVFPVSMSRFVGHGTDGIRELAAVSTVLCT